MRTRTQNLKRLLSLALCLCMVTGLLPTAALAAEPAITTETLAEATVGVYYETTLTATPSDQNGTLSWSSEDLPGWLTLSGSGETATLTGTPDEAGEVTFTVKVTETIPAAEPEEPAAQEAGPDGVTEPAGESQPTVLTASRTYTLTVAEAAPANDPADEPAANAPLTDGAGATRGITADGTVTATIYTGYNEYDGYDGETSEFPVDQTGLILDMRSFSPAIPEGWTVSSLAFYPIGSTDANEWGDVFWYSEGSNGTAHDKFYMNGNYNGVFQVEGFTPNGGFSVPAPGTYQVLAYIFNETSHEEKYYLSNETFTITEAAGPGEPVINTTTLETAYVGEQYNQTLQATPGTTGNTLTWEVTQGSLPTGLSLNENTGEISGTPTAAGTSTFTVQVTETPTDGGEALTATKQFTLTVTAKLEITNDQTSFNLTRGEPFTLQLTANQPVTWSFQVGYMPGLRLSGDTISGTVSSYTSSGTYTATMRATAEDGQTADITLTFIVGNLYAFTLPESLSNDMIGHYAYLRATLDGKEVTLWIGALSSPSQKLTVYSAYSGEAVDNVELYVRLNKGGNVEAVLAEAAGSVTLEDGGSSGLTAASTDSIIALPKFDYGGLDNYVSAWFEDSDGYRYYSGDLATNGMTFTLEVSANASQYRQDGHSGYDLTGTPTFNGAGVTSSDDGYTYSPNAGDIIVAYPRLTKQNVTFTLEPVSGAEPEDLTGAQLSIQQYVNGAAVRTSATITSGSTATAELYLGAETTVTLLRASNCGLKDTKIDPVEEENTLEYWTSAQTGISLILTTTLSNMEDKDLLTYAECLTRNSIYPTITVGGESWNGRGGFSSSLSVTKNIGKPLSFGIWNYDYADEIQSMVDSGGTYSLSWSATQNLLDGKLENQKWPSDQLSASVELPINLKGGVLLSLTYSGRSAAHLQDWWYDSSSNTWITSGNRTSVYSTKGEARNYAFCCPGKEGRYNFILLPREVQPTGMTWADAAEYYAGMPALEDVPVENNTVASGRFMLSEVQAAAARYLTLPNSTLSGPAQFTSTEELLSFTGGIQLDEGVDGKLKTLRIEAGGTDRGGRVAFQISSLQIGGKTYPYAGIHLEGEPVQANALMNEQFTTYYEITFSEPITLPCTFTLYGNAMSYNSDVNLTLSAVLDDVTGVETSKLDQWQSLGTVTAQGPALSVAIPAAVGTETATAYLTIPGPSSARVDIYDGDTLVVPSARAGEVEIPLVGTSPSRTTSHNLSFRWRTPPPDDASGEPYEVTVLHTNGLPTLVSQQLQVKVHTNWHTFERDRIYSFASNDPNPFRAVCEIANSENIQGGVTFLFHLLDGTTVSKQVAAQSGDTFTSEVLNTNSPVIAVSVVFETDWTKVNEILQEAMRPVPANSPTETGAYNFDQTIVLSYDEYQYVIPQVAVPSQGQTFTPEDRNAIAALQDRIERVYENNRGDAGYYIIGDGSEYFYRGREMIEQLEPGVLPEGYTGETTFTRPLTPQQLDGELGGGDGWTRLTFVEPGENGGWGGTGEGGTTGLEIYTTEFTTDSGVTGTITIARIGTGDDAQIIETGTATARGTGTGGGTPTSLPESDTINPGDAGGQNLFSFTTFRGPSDMEVFTNWCDDTGAAAGITGSLLEILGMEGAGGAWNVLGGIGNVLGAAKSFSDGISNSMSLSELHAATLQLLSSRCAQKLPSGVYNSLDSQIRNFSEMAIEAMAWNAATSMGNVGTGLAGAAGIMSNPWTAFTEGVALLGGSWINRQQMDNVRNEAQLIQDSVQFQITKNAMATGDQECMPKGRSQGNTAPYRVCIDPSGIVYEAVLSNPVEDATVTLYTDGTGFVPEYSTDDNGIPIMVNNGAPATPTNGYSGSGTLTTPVDSTIPAENVLTTGADGRFQWMVEQGLWYVTAYKDGYQPGDSGNDVAAVVSDSNGRRWLPVSPEQTNVNIPLVSLEPPTVTAEAREDGVYLTFSKYMDEDTLTEDNFTLTDSAGNPISISGIQLLNSEQAPSNIDYNGAEDGYGTAPSYTSQVKLCVTGTLSSDVTVTIDSAVESYAGAPCAVISVIGTFSEEPLVDAPEVIGDTDEVAYGATVTLTIPQGAVVYYTTDGTDPSYDDHGQPTGTTFRYYTDQPIVITKSMTLKAVAVKYGVPSAVTSAEFTVPGTGGTTPDEPDDEPDTPATPGGTTGGGGSSGYSVSVPASSSIKGGSITVSPRSADKGDTVTITVKPDDGYELNTLTVTDAKGNELELTDKGSGKYTFAMPGSSVKIRVSFRETAAQAVNPFTDVSGSAYYYDAVLWAVANGVTNGTTATTFSTNVTVTRAQMVTFLWRAHGAPKAAGSNPFTDVSSNAYYYDAVLWAVANGVTNGTTATTFSPNAPVTRAQAVTFQWRASGSPAVSGGSFSDVAADAYYSGAVAWAVANGITNGTTATTFSPDTPVSRAQAVTFLYRELA